MSDDDYIGHLESKIKKLREVLQHSDFEGIDCSCGYYGEDDEMSGMSECLRCGAKRVLEENDRSKI